MEPLSKLRLVRNCEIGAGTTVWGFTNLYGCKIGKNGMIGTFVEIQSDVEVGDGTRIQSHTFIPSKTVIGKNCFIGHGVVFINDRHPPRGEEHWEETIVGNNVVIGSNATIFPVKIGDNATIGAGSVVLKDVGAGKTVVGNPAKEVRSK